ncbi:MAG: cupin domain-containing protein [Candidatus Bipolaricaulia bacterium]
MGGDGVERSHEPQEVRIVRLDEALWCKASGQAHSLIEGDRALSAGVFQFKPGQRVPEEGFTAHEGTEVSLVLSGEVTLGLEDQSERTVRGGELVIIPRGVPHYSYNPGSQAAHIVWVIAAAVEL